MRRRVKGSTWAMTDTLILKSEAILEKILDSHRGDQDVQELVPNISFLLEYLGDVLEFRRMLLGNKELLPILEKIELDKVTGERLGFNARVLWAFARVIAKNTPTSRKVAEWEKKFQEQ